jgi:hypothetical protein
MKSDRLGVRALGVGAARLSTIILELNSGSEALGLAKKAAEETERTVTVRNEEGEVLGVFRGVVRN